MAVHDRHADIHEDCVKVTRFHLRHAVDGQFSVLRRLRRDVHIFKHADRDLAVQLIVLGDKHADPVKAPLLPGLFLPEHVELLPGGRFLLRFFIFLRDPEGEIDREAAALARQTADRDRASGRVDNALADRQAETAALHAAHGGPVLALERIENLLHEVLGHPDAVVRHHNLHGHIAARRGRAALHAEAHTAALRRIFHCISEEIGDDLGEAHAVAVNALRQAVIDKYREPCPSPCRLRPDQIDSLRDQLADLMRRLLHRKPSALDVRDVKDVTDQRQEMIARLCDLIQIVLHNLRLRHMLLREGRKPDDRVERRADVVRHIAEKERLRLRRLSSLTERGLKRLPLRALGLHFLLDARKAEQHVRDVLLPLPGSDELDPIAPRRKSPVRLNSENEPRRDLALQLPPYRVCLHFPQKMLAVLRKNARLRKDPDRLGVGLPEAVAVAPRDIRISPVNVICVAVEVHKIDGLVVDGQALDHAEPPHIFLLDQLLLGDIAHNDDAHDIAAVLVLRERKTLAEVHFISVQVVDHVLDPRASLADLIHDKQVLAVHHPNKIIPVVRHDAPRPVSRVRVKRSRHWHALDRIEDIRVAADGRDDPILRDINFK